MLMNLTRCRTPAFQVNTGEVCPFITSGVAGRGIRRCWIDALLSAHDGVIRVRLIGLVVVDDQHRTVEAERQLTLVVAGACGR